MYFLLDNNTGMYYHNLNNQGDQMKTLKPREVKRLEAELWLAHIALIWTEEYNCSKLEQCLAQRRVKDLEDLRRAQLLSV